MTEAPGLNPDRRRWPVYACYAVAFAMVICFAAVLSQFLFWLFPTSDPRGILIACALAVLESFSSFWLIKRLPTAQRQIAYFRVTELVIMLVAVKFLSELRAGPASFWNNFLLWPVQFPFNVLNGRFFFVFLPVLASWWIGNLFAYDLSLLGKEDVAALDERLTSTPLRKLILRRFFGLGMFAVLLAGIPAQSALQISLPVTSNGIPAVLALFILGIILISLTRYITLETNWRQEKLNIPAQIPRRWFAYSILILAVLVLLISWLPTNYGMGLFDTLNAVFRLIYQFFMLVYGLILTVITLIAQLLAKKTPDSPTPLPPPDLPAGILPKSNGSPIDWRLVQSVIMWGSLIVLAILALRQYIAYNRDLSAELRRFRPLRWLVGAWDRFKATFKKANRTVGVFIQNSLKRLRRLGTAVVRPDEWDFINPRRLTSRQKIIFYYLALVRRAREAGLPRQDNQTPYEYARSLTSSLQEEKDGLDVMTESFIEARYSRHDIPAKQARRTESIWETIRQVLRNVRRSSEENRTKKD